MAELGELLPDIEARTSLGSELAVAVEGGVGESGEELVEKGADGVALCRGHGVGRNSFDRMAVVNC